MPDGAAQNCPACCLACPARTTSGPFRLPPTKKQPHLLPAFDGCYGCKVRTGYVNNAPADIRHFVGSVNDAVQEAQAPGKPQEVEDNTDQCRGACDRNVRTFKCGNTASRESNFDLNVLVAGVCSHVFPLVNTVVLCKRGGACRVSSIAAGARALPHATPTRCAPRERCPMKSQPGR